MNAKTHLARPNRILVIDDEQAIRQVLQALLTKDGFEVGTASCAAEALEFLTDDPPDLVISDIDIGGDDGLHLLQEIKRLKPGLPVIMLTGMGYDDDLMQEARAGKADGYVSKLLPPRQLLGEVRRVLHDATRAAGASQEESSPVASDNSPPS